MHLTADPLQTASAQVAIDPTLRGTRPSTTRHRRRLGRRALLALALLLVIAVPAASAATTDQIVRDVRDGQVDGTYRAADLRAALASPLLKTYGGKNGVEAVKSALGSQTEGTTGSGELPFTGAELTTFVALGSILLLAGFVLRRQTRAHHADGDG